MKKLATHLFQPIDNSPLVVFRIFFGLLICLEAWGAILTGWVKKAFITPDFTFPFIEFSWLQPLPGNWMYVYYIVMGTAGLLVMLGWYYKFGIGLYTVLWAGAYFMQKTNYNNHYYLLLILLLAMCIVPANRYASLDVKRKPEIQSLTCPRWCVWLFITQITIVYFYASIAKIHPDWIEGKPISIMFANKQNYFLIGSLLQKEWLQSIVVYGGILFDGLVVPGLLWRKTRKYAFALSIPFHLFNSIVFQVGIFPYLALAWTLFFYPPEVSRKLFLNNRPALSEDYEPRHTAEYKVNRVIIGVLIIHFAIQILLPLRHHYFKSNVLWTEEGHRLAWRMMLRVKRGDIKFTIKNKDGHEEWEVKPTEYVTYKQASFIAYKPDFLWQFVQILKKDYTDKGYPDIEIYAKGKISVNGDKKQALYDPKVDLAKVRWHPWKHAEWLLPEPQNE